ncbi:hypothetical protein AWB78_01351 [Caballeronia calidae]|uniref:Uncharacterized protein n=1 Tax=Caballeronia calidae TaxID=1777139 RepID=A0A158A7L0_9BURK|nr:hypothetical protein AWB78_01351 [Caballeronia calidae]
MECVGRSYEYGQNQKVDDVFDPLRPFLDALHPSITLLERVENSLVAFGTHGLMYRYSLLIPCNRRNSFVVSCHRNPVIEKAAS